MKAVVGAVLARCPTASAGHTCAVMNWVMGLKSLGWDVWIVEHLAGEELGAPVPGESLSPQELFWHETAKEFGLADRQCLIVEGKSPDLEAFEDFAATADVFLNYSGQFKRLDLLGDRLLKCYLDVDPGFTQLWSEVCRSDMNFAGHDLFLTVGSNFASEEVRLPKTEQAWIPLVPPVAGDYWREYLGRVEAVPPHRAWSTVAHWYGYNDLVWEGRTYGGKRDSLFALRDLPRQTGQVFTIASDLQAGWEDYDAFLQGGWQLLSSAQACQDVASYLHFLSGSGGEIGVAKGGYVVSRGGWISDRSVIYLALGCPVVLQDTGWPSVVEPRPGFLSFVDASGAAKQVAEISSDRALHCAGARALADSVFSPASALAPLLDRLG